MSLENVKEGIIDPELVAEQYQKHERIKKKLEQLQTPVFKNYTIKKSKSVIHPNHKQDKPLQIPLRIECQREQLNQKAQNISNVTTISFVTSIQKKTTSIKQVQSARVLPSFLPLKHKLNIKKPNYMEQNTQLPINQMLKPLKHSLSQKNRSQEKRNSQTILRKNLLFMSSSLKTRYRQIQQKAHIGNIDGVANIKLASFNQKTARSTHYQQRFQYMEEVKQRLLMTKISQGQPQLFKNSSLLLQPW